MDERAITSQLGKPIPAWDLRHRLPLTTPVSPECKDSKTVFKINSKYMDITDQPYMIRHEMAFGVIVMAGFCIAGILILFMFIHPNASDIFTACMAMLASLSLPIYFCVKFGREEFFSLTRRPIRFHRKNKKIYAIRHRKFFLKPGNGDVMKEISWNNNAIFCIHRTFVRSRCSYHIRYYEIDNNYKIVDTFSLGRDWADFGNVADLLAQWNFWCTYMNEGPKNLPKPVLYFKENENLFESLLFCLDEFSLSKSKAFWLLIMPFVLIFATARVLSLLTCRRPIWPASVEEASVIDDDNPYEQPRGATPTGWAQTGIARERGEYPIDPQKTISPWHGKSVEENGALWTADTPPRTNWRTP